MPVYQDSMPVHQDITPVLQDLEPVYYDSTPVCQDLMHVFQDFMPASQDLFIVKDVCAASYSVSEVYKPFILLKDTGASRSVLLANVLHFSEKSYSDKSVLLQDLNLA